MTPRGKLVLFSAMVAIGLLFGLIFHFLLMPFLHGIAYCVTTALLLQIINYVMSGSLYRRIARKWRTKKMPPQCSGIDDFLNLD